MNNITLDYSKAIPMVSTEELLDMGLSIPQVTQVFLQLKKLGVETDNVYTIDQAVAALKMLKGGRANA